LIAKDHPPKAFSGITQGWEEGVTLKPTTLCWILVSVGPHQYLAVRQEGYHRVLELVLPPLQRG
jgi:hypothetical protein